jgi:hypothetical protein
MRFIGVILRFFMERGARNKSYDDLLTRLEADAARTGQRFQAAVDTPANRRQAAHIIGIERWAQRRLRTLLGEPLVMDEYDGYAPSLDMTAAQLADAFRQTRADTLTLTRTLKERGIPITQTAKHNDMDQVTVGGWLVYIAGHGGIEARRLK